MSEEREPAFNPDAGEHVESAACRLLAMARERNAEVFCLFNDTRMTARPGMLLEEVLDGWSEGRRRTNETTPDAVEMLQRMHACVVLSENHGDVPRVSSDEVLAALRAVQAERAQHAEEVDDIAYERGSWCSQYAEAHREEASLRDQLRRAEGERDAERKHATEMEERALDLVRDLRLAQVELHALRSLLPDVRACAEYCRNILIGPPGLAPVALAARHILAALDSQGGEGE